MKSIKAFLQGFFFAFISIGALPFLFVKSLLEQL
jgi:hypothetical protein